MKIQVITDDSEHEEFSKSLKFKTNIFSEHESLDTFDLNIIDFSSQTFWKGSNYFNNVPKMIHLDQICQTIFKSTKSDILVIFPQNISISSTDFAIELKYNLKILNTISKYVFENTECNFFNEKTSTKIKDKTYNATFYIETRNNEVKHKSIESEKSTTIRIRNCTQNENRLFHATTLDVFNSQENLENFIKDLYPKFQSDESPKWFGSCNILNDVEENTKIQNYKTQINSLLENIEKSEEILSKNNRIKSILYLSGEELENIVREILGCIFDCDLSTFEDLNQEDFEIKKENITFIGEIKGVNTNVRDEYILQTRKHYGNYKEKIENQENLNLRAILVINHTLKEEPCKRKAIHNDQIDLAKRNQIIIVEMPELLKIYEKIIQGELSSEDCIKIFSELEGLLSSKDIISKNQ